MLRYNEIQQDLIIIRLGRRFQIIGCVSSMMMIVTTMMMTTVMMTRLQSGSWTESTERRARITGCVRSQAQLTALPIVQPWPQSRPDVESSPESWRLPVEVRSGVEVEEGGDKVAQVPGTTTVIAIMLQVWNPSWFFSLVDSVRIWSVIILKGRPCTVILLKYFILEFHFDILDLGTMTKVIFNNTIVIVFFWQQWFLTKLLWLYYILGWGVETVVSFYQNVTHQILFTCYAWLWWRCFITLWPKPRVFTQSTALSWLTIGNTCLLRPRLLVGDYSHIILVVSCQLFGSKIIVKLKSIYRID